MCRVWPRRTCDSPGELGRSCCCDCVPRTWGCTPRPCSPSAPSSSARALPSWRTGARKRVTFVLASQRSARDRTHSWCHEVASQHSRRDWVHSLCHSLAFICTDHKNKQRCLLNFVSLFSVCFHYLQRCLATTLKQCIT